MVIMQPNCNNSYLEKSSLALTSSYSHHLLLMPTLWQNSPKYMCLLSACNPLFCFHWGLSAGESWWGFQWGFLVGLSAAPFQSLTALVEMSSDLLVFWLSGQFYVLILLDLSSIGQGWLPLPPPLFGYILSILFLPHCPLQYSLRFLFISLSSKCWSAQVSSENPSFSIYAHSPEIPFSPLALHATYILSSTKPHLWLEFPPWTTHSYVQMTSWLLEWMPKGHLKLSMSRTNILVLAMIKNALETQ